MTQILKQSLGLYKANCYVLKDDGQAIVIDPGFHAHKVLSMIGDDQLLGIILTHGHCDHICAVDGVRQVKAVPVYMNPGDDELLRLKRRMPSAYKGLCQSPYIPLYEGPLEIGPFKLSIFEMPGHSMGSVVIQWEQHIFTGDTLFKNSIGATNNYNGNSILLRQSLKRIMRWDPDLIIHPGHAEDTTLATELAHNLYLHIDSN